MPEMRSDRHKDRDLRAFRRWFNDHAETNETFGSTEREFRGTSLLPSETMDGGRGGVNNEMMFSEMRLVLFKPGRRHRLKSIQRLREE
jgi:hypothetical protein